MERHEKDEARDRIVKAAITLFSEKGFDGTRVNEISEAAEVNKALIYYYFKNKEAILDYLQESLFSDMASLSLYFIRENMIEMINRGELDIEEDRFHFSDEEALEYFLQNIDKYYEKVIDYVIERRQIFRILMLESLKQKKRPNSLFQFIAMLDNTEANPIYKMIKNADSDYKLPFDMVIFKFFFGIIPIISLASYIDDWVALRSVDEQQLRNSFVQNFQLLMTPFISGTDIMLKCEPAG